MARLWPASGRKKHGVKKKYAKLTDKLPSSLKHGSSSHRLHEKNASNCLPLPKILASRSPIEELHRLFPSIPEEEYPLNVFACALSKEILLQGKMFVTQNYVCFYSNIFGFETKVMIELKDVVLIKREKTVFVLPNAIALKTLRKKFFFCSFLSRETVYKLLSRTWQKALIEAASDYSGKNNDSSVDSDPGGRLDSDLDSSLSYTDGIPDAEPRHTAWHTTNSIHDNNNISGRRDHNSKTYNENDFEERGSRLLAPEDSSHQTSPNRKKRFRECPLWSNASREFACWVKRRLMSHFKRQANLASFFSCLLIILVVLVSLTSVMLMVRVYLLSSVLVIPGSCPGCSNDPRIGEADYRETFHNAIGRMKKVVGQNIVTVQKAYSVLDDFRTQMRDEIKTD